jgi:serine/threonine protein phosphatase PrpC
VDVLHRFQEGRQRKVALTTRFNSAGLSDPGRKRENNEDRFHADPERGIYFVIDGVGGQAAGEKAADTAYQILRARLERSSGTVPDRIREAITLANNEIYQLASDNDEWHGMACVLTVAVVEEHQVTVGQVGDSRLYVITPGEIRKITHDHSPVGEREDRGEIDEVSAMRHPRRNEVYRDVGTVAHRPEDADFIEVTTEQITGESLLLLCSDGLSDLVTSRQILSIVEAQAGNPQMAAKALVDAANEAGGKDNITVVLVEGPRFAPGVRRRLSSPRTTIPLEPIRSNPFASKWAFLLYGLLVALALVYLAKPHWLITQTGTQFGWGAYREPVVWRVSNEIGATIENASPGDTILVAPGTYNEQIRLRDGINLVSEVPRQAIIRANGIAISGEDLRSGRVEGFRIQPDETVYLQVGIQLVDSAVSIVDNEITGTVTAGIQLQGSNRSVLRANSVEARSRAALVIEGAGGGPRVVGNELAAEGHPAVVVTGDATPELTGNVIRAAEPVFLPPKTPAEEFLRRNFVIQPPRPAGVKPPPTRNAPARAR